MIARSLKKVAYILLLGIVFYAPMHAMQKNCNSDEVGIVDLLKQKINDSYEDFSEISSEVYQQIVQNALFMDQCIGMSSGLKFLYKNKVYTIPAAVLIIAYVLRSSNLELEGIPVANIFMQELKAFIRFSNILTPRWLDFGAEFAKENPLCPIYKQKIFDCKARTFITTIVQYLLQPGDCSEKTTDFMVDFLKKNCLV